MRRGEILALEWSDITGRVANIKRKHPTRARAAGKRAVAEAEAGQVAAGRPARDHQPPAPARAARLPLSRRHARLLVRASLRPAGIEGVVFHRLRHECLLRLADRGFDPLRLAMVGGHRDLRNVKRYANLDAEKLANE